MIIVGKRSVAMPELIAIGTSHHTAPVAVREGLALAPEQTLAMLRGIHADRSYDEALLLSTCNRTEFYVVPRRGGPEDLRADLLARIGRARGAAPPEPDPAIFYRHEDRQAVRHLFRVAASLESQIVGESEILGQVKDAYRLAVEARTTGFLLNRLLHRAFRVGKRVRTETTLEQGSSGVPQAAVELAGHIFAGLEAKTVLLVGAGQTAEAAARALLVRGAGRLIVANRTLYRAQQLALDLAEAGGTRDEDGADDEETPPRPQRARIPTEAVDLDALPEAVVRADLVIASTGATEPVLTREALAPALARRAEPLMIVDIAVPRDVDPALGRLESVYLYDLDDLDRLVERNLERRRREIPKADAVVEDEVREFLRWLASRQVAPTIRLLKRRLRSIRRRQIDRYGGRFADSDREELEAFAEAMAKRVLHHPIALLKHLATDGATSRRLATVDLVRQLFDLDTLEEADEADDAAAEAAEDSWSADDSDEA
jgi:glutamyl-tRNA reductase